MHSTSIALLIIIGFLEYGWADDSSGSNNSELSIGRRVINGEKDLTNEFGYVVPLKSVYNDDDKQCSGTLLSTRTVITSISCVNKANGLSRVEVTLASGKYFFWPEETYNVPMFCFDAFRQYLYLGPTMNPSVCFESGLVLLRLDIRRPAMSGLSSIVFPKVPTNEIDYTGLEGIIAGWGNTKGDNEALSSFGLYIYSRIPFLKYDRCYNSINLPPNLKTSVYNNATLCSFTRHATGLCAGDEGGALLLKYNGFMYIVGVHRNLFSSCTAPDPDHDINTLMLHYNLKPAAEYIQKMIRYRS